MIGFLPALAVMHTVLESLALRAAKSGKGPESTETVSVVLPFLPPIVLAVLSWLIVTSP